MERIVKKLENKGIRPTPVRLLMFKKLLESNVALSLGVLENYFEKSERSTLFRTMRTFEKNKIVHQIMDGTGVMKYALCQENCDCEVGNYLHLHFHCNLCNETMCLTDRKIPVINLPQGYMAENINLVLKGVCNKCNGQ